MPPWTAFMADDGVGDVTVRSFHQTRAIKIRAFRGKAFVGFEGAPDFRVGVFEVLLA